MAQLNNQMEQFKHRVENLTDLENRILIPMVKIAELVSWTSGNYIYIFYCKLSAHRLQNY